MKILVTGAQGQVGSLMPDALAGHDLAALGRDRLDLTKPPQIHGVVAEIAPDVVINCAAYNAVDRAEVEPDAAREANAEGPGHLADACTRAGAHLLHMSTDYVFDGEKRAPYVEGDEPNPLSVYGRSKLEGERAVAERAASSTIVRTAWVFGLVGRSLVEMVLDRSAAGEPLRMVDDQRGCPTYAPDLAPVLAQLAVERQPGVFHVTNNGDCTPFELAEHVLAVAGTEAPLERITTAELGREAPRPSYSVLASERLAAAGIEPLRQWREAVTEAVPRLAAGAHR